MQGKFISQRAWLMTFFLHPLQSPPRADSFPCSWLLCSNGTQAAHPGATERNHRQAGVLLPLSHPQGRAGSCRPTRQPSPRPHAPLLPPPPLSQTGPRVQIYWGPGEELMQQNSLICFRIYSRDVQALFFKRL